jgi:hypothetical protein
MQEVKTTSTSGTVIARRHRIPSVEDARSELVIETLHDTKAD